MNNEGDSPVVANPGNGQSTPEQAEDVEETLRQEKQERDDFAAVLKEKAEHIAELETLLDRERVAAAATQDALDTASAEVVSLKESRTEAIDACRDALRLAHPELPPDLIKGESIQELTDSVSCAQALVEKVRAALEQERAATRVPAGAPVDSGPDLSGLSAREKISAGVTHPSK